jgi:ATP-dependent Clp protease ATP-binding subunit ClpA
MFERYTEKARRVIFFARYEASQLGSSSIETEHVLLGVLRENHDLARRFLAGEPAETFRQEIRARTPPREKVSTAADLPLSHESKRVLAYGAEEAERLGQKYIGTEHLFLGLFREEKCLAADILQERGLRLSQVREEIARSGPSEAGSAGGVSFGPRMARSAGQFGWMSALQEAGRVLVLARHEAAQRHSPCIETSDLLLAVTHEKEVNDRFPGPAESVRKGKQPDRAPSREKVSTEELPFSEDCKLACTLAAEEAAQLGQRTGPGHLLLGILRVESCAAAETLRNCGLTAEGIRAQLSPPPPPSDPEQGRKYV